jgi:hypothetical protein
MRLDALKPDLVDRLLRLETEAHHLTGLAAVADAYAYVAREKADAAQRALSEVKVFLALLPDGAALHLLAPVPDAADLIGRFGLQRISTRRGAGQAKRHNPPRLYGKLNSVSVAHRPYSRARRR